MRLRFELGLALRHLRSGGWQTFGTCAGVAVTVLMIVIVPALGQGMQDQLGRTLSERWTAVSVKPPRPAPLAGPAAPGSAAVLRRTDDQLDQRRWLEDWPRLMEAVRSVPEVTAVAPTVAGQVLVRLRTETRSTTLYGVDPEQQERVVPLAESVVQGHYFGLAEDEAVLGWSLAQVLGARLEDRILLTTDQGVSGTFRVAGIFDSGNDEMDMSRVFIPLRSAQGLLRTGQAVSSLSLRLRDSYQANAVAARLERLLPVSTETWMQTEASTLELMSIQSIAGNSITGFTMFSAALGIASVLSISVLQKSRQIGILKAIGARRRQIQAVFALEGLLVGAAGSVLGVLWAVGLLWLMTQIPGAPRASGRAALPLMPITLAPLMLVRAALLAIASALVASLLPAGRASRMDPVQVIRGG